ncbi:AsmA family protein, partial [bacterium]|nr:AsmA family protein [bacterium]
MRWKKLLIAGTLVVVVLIAAVYVIVLNLDFNRFKPQVAQLVFDATGRELTIAGNIDFEIGIRPTLIVEDVRFQNSSWSSTPDLARVKKLEVQIAVLPMIIGKFDFAHLVLIEPTVIVEFDRAGTSNFSFDTASQEQDDSEIAPPPLIFSDIRIEKGHFTYRDAQSDFKFIVRIDHLTGEIPGFDKSLQLNFEGAFNNIPLRLNGTVGPIWAWVEPGYELPVDIDIASGGATARVKGEMRDPTHFKDLAFTIAADDPSTADIARLVGVTDSPDLGAFKLTARVTDPEANVFSIDDLFIALGENEITGLVKLNMAKKVPFLTAQFSSQKFVLGPASLDLHLIGPMKKPAVKKIDLTFGTEKLVKVRLNGVVDDLMKLQGVAISFQASGRDLANLEQLAGQPLPVRGAFSAAGKVLVPVQKNLRIPNLKITAGKNNVTGSLNLDLRGDRPQLRANLASPKLNLPSVLVPDLAKQKWAKGVGLMYPVKLAAELAGFKREIALEKIDLQAGTSANSAELRLTGSVANLLAQRGIDLNFSLRGNNVEKLKDITGQPYFFAPVPGEGAYTLSGHISDPAPKVYKVKDFNLEMSGTVLAGSLDFNLTGDLPIYDVKLSSPKFNMKPFPIPKEAAFAKLNQIDDLGPLKMQSRVVVEKDRLSLPNLVMQAGHKQLVAIEVKGSIHNLTTQTGINLNVNIQG